MDGNVDSWKIAHVAGVEPDPQNSYYESKGVSGMYRSGRNPGVRACRWSSHYWSTSGHACCDLWKSCRDERIWVPLNGSGPAHYSFRFQISKTSGVEG
ncbi:hypothetical protein MTP99_016711 [Tenebrio molitor]|nr:hypothetical protein MTP99_016711 [Tenebrio molitor]